jgi:FixJ family two-component response regulator
MGMTSLQISKKLNLSKRTVDKHRSNIMQKFNLKSLADLVHLSIHYNYKVNV